MAAYTFSAGRSLSGFLLGRLSGCLFCDYGFMDVDADEDRVPALMLHAVAVGGWMWTPAREVRGPATKAIIPQKTRLVGFSLGPTLRSCSLASFPTLRGAAWADHQKAATVLVGQTNGC